MMVLGPRAGPPKPLWPRGVSILLVMDDGLGEIVTLDNAQFAYVSILLVMDDGLGGLL